MSTPVSGSLPYCTPARYFIHQDWRPIGDLLGDGQGRIDLSIMLSSGPPPSTPYQTLYALLQEASGDVEIACVRGNRYSIADLQNLSSAAQISAGQLSNASVKLEGMVAGLTTFYCWDRRGGREKGLDLPLKAKLATELLAELEAGGKVFPLQETMNAGNATPRAVSTLDFQQAGGVVTRARQFFGRRVGENNGWWGNGGS